MSGHWKRGRHQWAIVLLDGGGGLIGGRYPYLFPRKMDAANYISKWITRDCRIVKVITKYEEVG